MKEFLKNLNTQLSGTTSTSGVRGMVFIS